MKPKKEIKKPKFTSVPSEECYNCDGRGEVKDQYITRFWGSSNWTYKKCVNCNGTGKNLFKCVKCKELLTGYRFGWYCTNENCQRCGLLSLLVWKQK